MKKAYYSMIGLLYFISLISFSSLFTSCEFYNFSQPQPYDRERIYQFPDEFIGKWKTNGIYTSDVEFTVPLNGKGGSPFTIENGQNRKNMIHHAEEDSSLYCIYKDYLTIVVSATKKVLVGEWPKRNSENELIYPPLGFEAQYEIRYDSLNNPVDTVSDYIISHNRIYERDPDRFLKKGYEFIRLKDTITVLQIDSLFIDLGQNAFLCKLTDSIYIININNSILGLGEGENWWKVVILELAGDGKFNQWECSSKTNGLSCMFYERPSKNDQFYFDCRWSAAEILGLMREGYFIKTDAMNRLTK